jgi:Chlorophyll A-B binding protein
MAKNTAKTPTPNDLDAPKLGWNDYAERLNGRFAMIGLVTLLTIEFVTRQDFFTWLGLK